MDCWPFGRSIRSPAVAICFTRFWSVTELYYDEPSVWRTTGVVFALRFLLRPRQRQVQPAALAKSQGNGLNLRAIKDIFPRLTAMMYSFHFFYRDLAPACLRGLPRKSADTCGIVMTIGMASGSILAVGVNKSFALNMVFRCV